MMSGKTIVCFASGYDAPPTSKHHVMHLLAERNVVLWVNYHASRAPSASGSDMLYIAQKLRQVAGGLRTVRPNLHVLTPLVVPLPSSSLARKINRAMLLAQIRAALGRIRQGALQVWSFTPDVSYLLDGLEPERVVYYCVDDFAEFTGYDKDQVLRDEADLCGRADLVVTTSRALQDAKAHLNPNTMLVPHGVDFDHFARAVTDEMLPMPNDMRGIERPVLGFFGLIRDWVDLDLLAEVARRRPDWHVVLLGDSTVELGPYRSLPNMHFLGRKAYDELPAYCRCFDVGLIPFRHNELTRAVNPIKLREYLAAALPVVSTSLPEVAAYAPMVDLADTPEETVEAVEQCLAMSPEARAELNRRMADETWPHKVNAITERLESSAPRRGSGGPMRRKGKLLIGVAGGGFAIQSVALLARKPSDADCVLFGELTLFDRLAERFGVSGGRRRTFSFETMQTRHSGPLALARSLVLGVVSSVKVLRDERPDAVVAVGQRIGIYLLLAARLLGIRTVFVECLTRVTRPSLTGRVISTLGLADRFYVQWPEARRLYRRAIYAGQVL